MAAPPLSVADLLDTQNATSSGFSSAFVASVDGVDAPVTDRTRAKVMFLSELGAALETGRATFFTDTSPSQSEDNPIQPIPAPGTSIEELNEYFVNIPQTSVGISSLTDEQIAQAIANKIIIETPGSKANYIPVVMIIKERYGQAIGFQDATTENWFNALVMTTDTRIPFGMMVVAFIWNKRLANPGFSAGKQDSVLIRDKMEEGNTLLSSNIQKLQSNLSGLLFGAQVQLMVD